MSKTSASNVSNWKHIILLSICWVIFQRIVTILLPHYFSMMGRNIYILRTYVYAYASTAYTYNIYFHHRWQDHTLISRTVHILFINGKIPSFILFFNIAAKSLRLWSDVKRFRRRTNTEVIVSKTDDTIREQDIFISVWFEMFQILDSNDIMYDYNIILYCNINSLKFWNAILCYNFAAPLS